MHGKTMRMVLPPLYEYIYIYIYLYTFVHICNFIERGLEGCTENYQFWLLLGSKGLE